MSGQLVTLLVSAIQKIKRDCKVGLLFVGRPRQPFGWHRTDRSGSRGDGLHVRA